MHTLFSRLVLLPRLVCKSSLAVGASVAAAAGSASLRKRKHGGLRIVERLTTLKLSYDLSFASGVESAALMSTLDEFWVS